MKKLSLVVALVISVSRLFAQGGIENIGKNMLMGGVGLTYIDDKPFYAVRMKPDFGFGNFGVGLDLNLEFGPDGKLRAENFNETSDYLSIIRYIRYGQKGSSTYVRAGSIDYYTLGHGSIMYNYNNSAGFDTKRIGVVLDLDFDKFGFESIYSDFSQGGVLGVRGYVKPLKFTTMGSIPVLGNLEAGVTFASDLNVNAGVLSGYYDPLVKKFVAVSKQKDVSVYGFDLGLPLIRSGMFSTMLYYDYAKIANYGDGSSAGLLMNADFMGAVKLGAKLERTWNNNKFIPAYFDAFYEVERIQTNKTPFNSKIRTVDATVDPDNGYLGSLELNVLSMVGVIGSYRRLDKAPNSGQLNLRAVVEQASLPFTIQAGYDKVNIKNETDMFTLDDRSYMYAEVGYKPYPYLLVSMVYSWMFTPIRDKDDVITGYNPQKKVEPRVSFVYPLNTGKK